VRRVLALPTWQLLVALVGVSAALRLWAAEAIATPWIAPDELIYAELGRAFWRTGHLTLFGEPTRFFSFVSPVLAGVPLSLDDREAGYRLLQAMQAVVISLAAVPTYLWARAFVSRGWALIASILALVPPSLAYAGLVMTEVAFYPAFVLAAWAVWRALERPAPRQQAWALASIVLVCAVRLQGFVVALAYATLIAMDWRRVRRHAPVLVGFGVIAIAWTGWRLRHGGDLSKVLGAYQAAGESHYDLAEVARFVAYHLADVVLVTGVVPVVALLLLRDRDLRTFQALTLALTGWLALQVGMFASRHIGHTAERNLFVLVPLYAIACTAWLARGAPRRLAAGAVAAAAACVLLLVVFPFERFAALAAVPSNFSLIPFYEATGSLNLDLVVPLVAAFALVLCLALPRATIPLLLVLGVVGSVSVSRFAAHESQVVQNLAVGREKAWIDPLVDGPVAFLYSGDLHWETVWQSSFWNPSVRTVYGLLDAEVPGGIPQRAVGPFEEGRLVFNQGEQADARYALASDRVQLVGDRLGGSTAGYALWRVRPPFRVATWALGVDASGTAGNGQVDFNVYACRPGVVEGELLAPESRAIEVLRNGVRYGRIDLEPGVPKPVSVPLVVPPPAGHRLCTVTLHGDGPFTVPRLNARAA
jgi:hypothetical protein